MITLVLLAASLSGGAALQFASPPVRAQLSLIAERAAAVPGRPATLGLEFRKIGRASCRERVFGLV